MEKYITYNFNQTQKIGEMLAKELRGGETICMIGDLGSGKTTFAQGMLKGLGVKGPYTSPTFLVIKHYQNPKSKIQNVDHIDAYRVNSKDILDLGWKEIIADPKNVVIIEWAEKIKNIIPKSVVWINFIWKGENEREIIISSKRKA
jgi:tRNA threonylcarbamoyladenosine biosynthesis protein TsaE